MMLPTAALPSRSETLIRRRLRERITDEECAVGQARDLGETSRCHCPQVRPVTPCAGRAKRSTAVNRCLTAVGVDIGQRLLFFTYPDHIRQCCRRPCGGYNACAWFAVSSCAAALEPRRETAHFSDTSVPLNMGDDNEYGQNRRAVRLPFLIS